SHEQHYSPGLSRVRRLDTRPRYDLDEGRRRRSHSRKRSGADYPRPLEKSRRSGGSVEEGCGRAETCHSEILAHSNLKSSLTVVRTMWVFVRSTKGIANSAFVNLLKSSRLLNLAITIASVRPVTS